MRTRTAVVAGLLALPLLAGCGGDEETDPEVRRQIVEDVAEGMREDHAEREKECAEVAEDVEDGTYDYEAEVMGAALRVAAGDYDKAFGLCMKLSD